MKWEELVKLDNLCGGAPLAAIVFCCGAKKSCMVREMAMEILGIETGRYEEVKEKHRIEADGTCYGNLAYCCSLNEVCEQRDNALKKLNMSPADYLQYKFGILKELITEDKIDEAFKKRILYKFAFEMVKLDDLEEGKEMEGFRGLALGNPELTDSLIIIDYQPIQPRLDEQVKEAIRKSEFISARVDSELYNSIVTIAKLNGCNTSKIIRDALKLYVSLNMPKVIERKVYK